jgi:polysaccharide chain length determinant protein (PEP-CTERM system associated)
MLPQKFDVDQYKAILLRRKWYVIIPLVVTILATAFYLVITPRVYRASTLILVERQTVPENYISSTVTSSLSDRIATIKQQVTSRSNLESIVEKHQLYASKDPSEKDLTMQEKVELMRKQIGVNVHRGAAFSISFSYPDAKKVARVTDDLTTNFIDENLRVREEQSVGTTRFLESELARLEEALKQREAALTAYKQNNMGGLPDQLQANFGMLKQLSDKVVSIERSLDEARTQKIMIQGQISSLRSMSEALPPGTGSSWESGEETLVSPEVANLRQRLEALRTRYTENHPDVVKLKKLIARAEKKQPEAGGAVGDAPVDAGGQALGGDIFAGQVEALSFQMNSIEQTMRDLQGEKSKIEKQIAIFSKRIEETPGRELELIALQRDYDVINAQYNNLLSKKLQSQLAENMEMRQKGEQFRVVDRAKVPEKPFRPNVPKILLAGLFAGLAAGCGLALGLEYLDKSFRDHEEIGEFLHLPLLAVIPRIETAAEGIRRQRFRLIAYCLGGLLLVGLGISLYLWMNGNLQEWAEKIRSHL